MKVKMEAKMKVKFGNFEVDVYEPSWRFRVISALDYPLIFEDGQKIPPNLEMAELVKVTIEKIEVYTEEGVKFIISHLNIDPDIHEIIQRFCEDYPDPRIYVISDLRFLEIYRYTHKLPLGYPIIFISPIATPKTSRLALDVKRYYRDQWAH